VPVSDEKAQLIRGELHAGEDLVWIGEPRSRTWGALPFAALGLVCSLLGPFAPLCLLHIFAVETHVVRAALALCSAALFILGLYLVMDPGHARRWDARTIYAITTKRVLIWGYDHRGTPSLRVYVPAAFTFTHRIERADGTGDVCFIETCREGRDRRSDIVERVRFCDIDEVRVVDAKLRALRNA
jgi:hypothetical protein